MERTRAMTVANEEISTKCVSAIKDFVARIHPTGYATDKVAGSQLLDAEVVLNESWKRFESLCDGGWTNVRDQLSRTDELCLWYYAVRMAEMAVRRNDSQFIRFGLMALIVDDRFIDHRDVFSGLALLDDAAKRTRGDAEAMLRNAAKYASATKRSMIERFVAERGSGQSSDLRGVGFRVTGTGESFKYESTF